MHTICSSLNPLCISLNSSWWTASHFHLARNSVKSGNFSAKIAPSCWTVFIGVRKYFSHLSFTEQSETCEKYIFRNVVVALSLSNLPSFAKIFYEKGWRRSGEGDLIVRILCNEKDTLKKYIFEKDTFGSENKWAEKYNCLNSTQWAQNINWETQKTISFTYKWGILLTWIYYE